MTPPAGRRHPRRSNHAQTANFAPFMSCVTVVNHLISVTVRPYVHRTMSLRRSRLELDGLELEARGGSRRIREVGSAISAAPFTDALRARVGEIPENALRHTIR